MTTAGHTQENRLAHETSPYLLQHRHNPVDWWPWGPAALAEAKSANKPILLSVGYAACHWCHVMAHESFEDAATAAVMNDLFVNIKVDREERPDIDQIYMSALHHLGEQGGWPLTMFLTPEGEPVWGGTYFPKDSRYGRPAFTDVLREISRLFKEEPGRIEQNRNALMSRLAERARPPQRVVVGRQELDQVALQLGSAMDPVHGGLRGAPKFPQCTMFENLWRAGLRTSTIPSSPGRREAARQRKSDVSDLRSNNAGTREHPSSGDPSSNEEMDGRVKPGHDEQVDRAPPSNKFFNISELTLERICEGGIYDHVGGGFARYSVDAQWLVPHFEKMLYDNAQLLELLALAYRRSGNGLFLQRAQETAGWLTREMTTPGGGFCSSLDADSEGEEGKFYVWSLEEINRVLGADDAAFFAAHYDVTAAGNFEGHNILNRLKGLPRSIDDEVRLAMLRSMLQQEREKRVRPGLDDKVLADWNGLMIAALAQAGGLLGEAGWVALARTAFDFIVREMTRGDRLGHSWRDGRLLFPGLASDFAAMIRAALALHETTGERGFLEQALVWQAAFDRHYANPSNGGYYLTADDAEGLVVRPASTSDDATPNPNALAAQNLIRLAAFTGDHGWREKADRLIEGVLAASGDNLFAHVGILNAVDLRLNAAEIVVTGEPAAAAPLVQAALEIPFLTRMLVRAASTDALPASHPAQEKLKAATGPAAFVCVGETCSLPSATPEDLANAVNEMRR